MSDLIPAGNEKPPTPESFLATIARMFAEGTRFWLRVLAITTTGGAVLLGGAGVYFFGAQGLLWGAVGGAAAGVVLAAILFVLASGADLF